MILRALIARGTSALDQGAFQMQRGTPAIGRTRVRY